MPRSERTLWVGRVTVAEKPTERVVRIWTDGAAPGPADVVEEITDPFDAAWHGSFGGDAQVAAAEIPARADGLRGPLRAVSLAAPVRPRKVVCVGRNYRAHAEELGNEAPAEPLLFFKPPSCLIGSGTPIVLPTGFGRVDMEGELVVVIGRRGRAIPLDAAHQHIAGYTLGNDVTARELQKKDRQWTRAKGFDNFGPLGPFVRLGSSIPDAARLCSYVDDEQRQGAPLANMLFDVSSIITFISECMSLEPGDVIYTGTPSGVTPLKSGQVVRINLEGFDLGQLVNPVADATPS